MAGIYSANAALPIYAEVFDSVGKLDQLEGFASFFGADFYGLDRNQDTITLINKKIKVPDCLEIGRDCIVPLKFGETISWRLG